MRREDRDGFAQDRRAGLEVSFRSSETVFLSYFHSVVRFGLSPLRPGNLGLFGVPSQSNAREKTSERGSVPTLHLGGRSGEEPRGYSSRHDAARVADRPRRGAGRAPRLFERAALPRLGPLALAPAARGAQELRGV